MVSETPPYMIMFGLGLTSALPQISSSQLSSFVSGSGVLCCRARGAEWRWVDFEVGGVRGGGDRVNALKYHSVGATSDLLTSFKRFRCEVNRKKSKFECYGLP